MSQLPRSSGLVPKSVNSLLVLAVLIALASFSGSAHATELSVSPTTENFGTVNVGTSLSKTITLTNESSSSIKISNVPVWGAGFSIKGITIPLVLSPHDVSTFQVIFDPKTGTASTGGLIVTSDASDSPQRVTLSGTGWVPVGTAVPSTYFGLDIHPDVLNDKVPWPTMSFGSIRLWDTATQWAVLNPSDGKYDWTELTDWLNAAAQNGKTDLIYTFGVVPQWASSKPNDQTCVSDGSLPGSCDAPKDVNPDGTGTDDLFQTFVRALVAQAAGKIKYWELWNEPDCPYEWNGTMAQMVRMAKDAYTIIKAADPTALVLTPSSVDAGSGKAIDIWLPGYIAAGGGNYADIVAFHGYINPALGQAPENITGTVDQLTSSLSGPLATKPFWNTEGGWTQNTSLPNADMEAGFVARMYLMQWFKGVGRFYWFQYGNTDTGTLWVSGGLNPAGVAYGQVSDWLVGATLSGPCTATGTVWTCPFTKPGGIEDLAVWDSSKICTGNGCQTSSYTPSSIYTKYANLTGDVVSFALGATVQIGYEPILLENK
jgi:hypothetical protein